MSTKDPLMITKATCPKCGSKLVKVHLMSMGTTPGIDHIDIYCGIDETFISHMNVSPYEDSDNGERED